MTNTAKPECKKIPVKEAIDSLNDSVHRAHNLFSDLHGRIDFAIVHSPTVSDICKAENVKQLEPCSELTDQIKSIGLMVEELCARIINDLNSIEL